MPQDVQDTRTGSKQQLYKVLGMLRGMSIARAIHVAAKYRIADLLKSGPRSVADLADESHTDASTLHLLLAALASIGVFEEVTPEHFANTELSFFLRADVPESLLNAALYWGSDWQWATWGGLDYTVETGNRAFDSIFGQSLWQFLDQNVQEQGIFSAALSSFSASLIPLIVSSYDFTGISTLADIGGDEGSLLIAILKAYPMMQGILFERPAVLDFARTRIADAGLADRCTLVAGDMLEPGSLPVGADAYVLREVLHSWNDEHCVQILRNCRQAMKAESRLLTIEHIYYPHDTTTFTKFLGLQMKLEQEGHQRTQEEFLALYEAAGFSMQRVIPIPVPTTTILEGLQK